MQITLDELLNVMMARLNSLELMVDDLKLRINVLARLLKAKAEFTESDVESAVKDEFEVMKKAGMASEYADEEVSGYSRQLWDWLTGNVEEIKETLEKYRKKLESAVKQAERKPSIDIASPDLIKQLDQLKGKGKSPKIL